MGPVSCSKKVAIQVQLLVRGLQQSAADSGISGGVPSHGLAWPALAVPAASGRRLCCCSCMSFDRRNFQAMGCHVLFCKLLPGTQGQETGTRHCIRTSTVQVFWCRVPLDRQAFVRMQPLNLGQFVARAILRKQRPSRGLSAIGKLADATGGGLPSPAVPVSSIFCTGAVTKPSFAPQLWPAIWRLWAAMRFRHRRCSTH